MLIDMSQKDVIKLRGKNFMPSNIKVNLLKEIIIKIEKNN